jgi:hypothetical protein
MNRRDFLRVSAASSAALGATRLIGQTTPAANPAPSAAALAAVPGSATGATVAIPVAISAFADANFENALDDMQARGRVNTVLPFIFTHETARAGIPANRLRGGNFALPHMEYYKDTGLTYDAMRAPDYGDLDVLARLIPAAQKRGMKVFPWILEDNTLPKIPGWDALYEVDWQGQRATGHPAGPCANNPRYQNFTLGLVEDYARSYDIGGVMWGSERQGGLFSALSLEHGNGASVSGRVTCFCDYCIQKGKSQGINADKAREGFKALDQYATASRAGHRPTDGYFVTFIRLLLKYPELLAWETLWYQSRNQLMASIYAKIKSIKPAIPVGWHQWQNTSFSPFHRAEWDYAEVKTFSDFIRPALYNNSAGGRMKSFTDNSRHNIFGDLPPELANDMLYHMLNYEEAPYAQVTAAGFSADYVTREVRRAVDNLAGAATQIWPGIDIDVPVDRGGSPCTPEGVKAAIHGAFAGGAHGVILSRNYVEMKPANLSAAGAALKELGAA